MVQLYRSSSSPSYMNINRCPESYFERGQLTSISTHFSLAKALYSFINTLLDISRVGQRIDLAWVASAGSRVKVIKWLRCELEKVNEHKVDVEDVE